MDKNKIIEIVRNSVFKMNETADKLAEIYTLDDFDSTKPLDLIDKYHDANQILQEVFEDYVKTIAKITEVCGIDIEEFKKAYKEYKEAKNDRLRTLH